MLGKHGDSSSWLKATSTFPNGVPRFESREDCINFTKSYLEGGDSSSSSINNNNSNTQNVNSGNFSSNPYDPTLMHIFTTLTNWDQVTSLLLPNIKKAREEKSSS